MANHILLLSMSMLGRQGEYKYDEPLEEPHRETNIPYEGQLEPITRYMIKKICQKDSDELQILMLCTNKTIESTDNFAQKTAIDFFKDRIDRCKGTVSVEYVVEKLDEDAPENAISSVVSKIRSVKKENPDGQFWIDTHGGFRDVGLMMEAVVSLLEVDGIVPDQIFTVRIDGERSVIVNQKKSFEIFDFVAGMKEFINYGKTSVLREYYKDSTDENVKKLLDAMALVSKGIEECDSESYIDGLDKMGNYIQPLGKSNSELAIFAEYIQRDYGDLLDSKKRTVIGIIERCLKKEMYQQALTFIESLMPQEFMERKIVYYADNQDEIIEQCQTRDKKEYYTKTQYSFNKYLEKLYCYKKSATQNLCQGKPRETTIADFITPKAIEMFSDMYQGIYNNNQKYLEKSFLHPNGKGIFTLPESNIVLKTDLINKDECEMAGVLVRLHKELKRCRNMVNHCKKNRPEMDKIVNAMKLYVEYAKKFCG